MRRWKLSPMDLESISRWEDYSRAKDEMFVHTDIPEAPWYVVESEDKRGPRINMIAHLLSTIPYEPVPKPPLELPERPPSTGYRRTPREMQTYVPDHAATIEPPMGFARSGGAAGTVLSQGCRGRSTVRMRRQRDGGDGLPVPREPVEPVERRSGRKPRAGLGAADAGGAGGPARRRLDRLADR